MRMVRSVQNVRSVRSLAVIAVAAACASSPPPESAPAPPAEPLATVVEPTETEPPVLTECPAEPGLCFEVDPPTAELLVNNEPLGIIEELGTQLVFVKLEPGIHTITLTLEGYVTWRTEVSVGDGAEKIQVELEPKPEPK